MSDQISIIAPDDWHVHLRDGEMLKQVVAHTARRFQRAIVMPNLRPPVTTVAAARAYRDRIQAACPADLEFTPLMTAYLTDSIAPAELETGFREGVFAAAKLYPANATTNSAAPLLQARVESSSQGSAKISGIRCFCLVLFGFGV